MDQIDQKLIETLKSLRNDPDFGAALDFEGIHRRAMLRNGFDLGAAKTRYTLRDYVETSLWQLTHSMLKPMAAAAAVFVFAVVGSVAMAGASAQALPGEKLYPVKLGLEKAQLVLALSSDQRSGLRMEFVSRRLEEMVALAAMTSPASSNSVQLAADRFRSEVAGIQSELFTGASAPSASQKELAKTVGRQVERYSSTVATTRADLPEDVLGEIEEAIEETKEQVVEVIITAHEADQDEESAAELDEALEKEIAAVEAQFAESAKEAIATAQALREQGLYRRAFQVLKDFVFEAKLTQ